MRLIGVVLALLAAVTFQPAHAQTWPTKPVRYVNPYPAGGATDTLSRLYCSAMSDLTGQQFVVDNRGGGGGDIGVEMVAKSEPDGYTLGLGGIASHAISPTLKAGQTDTITFTFSEAVTGFDNADVSVTGGTLGTITQVDDTTY